MPQHPLTASRNRLLNALTEAHATKAGRRDFRTQAAELLRAFEAETREVSVKLINPRTEETAIKRVDIDGITPSGDNVKEILKWGAWLYSRGWEPYEAQTIVKITRAQPHTPYVHPMQKVRK